ncbi:TIGR00304 family membrane protein [Methanobacterium sp.]|uniref:TIGR00304 family membrane protein n=1 Tax=Methanobacterium sp. TaxID=2164 RepID=UPI002ABCE5B7|nr:TIGR00304 family protein [Methanobacterium sp.]MDY9923106.1 TIGR00304 family protein [Methanobacterium sp.]
MIRGETIVFIGIAAVITGMLLIFIGTAFLSSGKTEGSDNTKVSTGGVVLIGPIPIIFGNDKSMVSIAVLGAIIIMVISYILFYRGSL